MMSVPFGLSHQSGLLLHDPCDASLHPTYDETLELRSLSVVEVVVVVEQVASAYLGT
jgi:hypothetical protein